MSKLFVMNSPFTDYVDMASENFMGPVTEPEFNAPFTDRRQTYNSPFGFEETNDESGYVVAEDELSGDALAKALRANKAYMIDYGWQKYAKDILRVIGVTDDSWITNSADANLEFFTKQFADWQNRMSIVTSLKGVFGLNTWTYFQKKIGWLTLSNALSIDVDKAIKGNKTYSSTWSYAKQKIFDYLNQGRQVNDEYFAYMIAKFQNDINPAFNNNIKVDGILGRITWDILRTKIEGVDPNFDIKQHIPVGDAKTAAARYVGAKEKYTALMINALEKIQSDIETFVRNEPIEFNTTRETLYAVVNGIVGAVPLVGAAGNAMLDYNKAYWDNIKANLDREFDKARSLNLNGIIYVLKNQAVVENSTIIVQHSLEDKLKYSGSIRDQVFSDFTKEIERIMNLNNSPEEIMKLAFSNLIGAFSSHTRIYIHCRNTTDFKNWIDTDISNLLNDSKRQRLNIRFTRVHPSVGIRENNLSPAEVKNLGVLWELFKRNRYTLKDLKLEKDVFFNINVPLSVDFVTMEYKYNVEFSFYLQTLSPNGSWKNLTSILSLPLNSFRLPNNQITYKDDYNSFTRNLTDRNSKGLVYQDIILNIANHVMGYEYGLLLSNGNINLISTELDVQQANEAGNFIGESSDYSNNPFNKIDREEGDYLLRESENGFANNNSIAEVIQQEAAKVGQPCEGRTCWAKSVLNSLSGLNLSISNTLDEQTKNAIAGFQSKNNLPQTKQIDSVTERALLEADAIQRQVPSAVAIISTAKTKIEDWTKEGLSGVKKQPNFILAKFRDPRKLWAFVLHHMAFKRRGGPNKRYSAPEGYVNTGSHFCIMFDGRIIQLHPMSRMIWHGNCISPRSVAVEFEGNFPNIKGQWWFDRKEYKRSPDEDQPTQAQYDAGKFLASYLKVVLGTTHILAHRQSSDSRENDPGPDIWYNVGEWSINNLGMTEGGPTYKCGTGNPILSEWRTWGNKKSTLTNKEYADMEEEMEWEDYDYNNESLYTDPEMTEESGPENEDFFF